MDLDDIAEQVWGPKRIIWEFKDRDDTDEQVWGLERSIYEFKDQDDTTEQIRGPLVHFTLIYMLLYVVILIF
jgi:hypothetical protein